MHLIPEILHDMWGNLMEAQDKIEKAYEMSTKHKAAADWYKVMAFQHLEFNRVAHITVTDKIAKCEAAESTTERERGKLDSWSDDLAMLQAKTARVRAMVEEYK